MIEEVIEDTVVNLLRLSVTELPSDVKKAIRRALKNERNEVARSQLITIIKNLEIAEETGRPICQDTGTVLYYFTVGDRFPVLGLLKAIVTRATRRATEAVPLRPNAVNPFTGRNSGNNTGRTIPYIDWKIIPGDELEITVLPKGGGSENMCALGMLNPSLGVDGIRRFVLDSVVSAGGKPCPPIILGVGVGGGADIALKLAKEALLRPIDRRHSEPKVAELEREILSLINMLGIGPLGLGGDTTALGVNIEYAHRHPASLPVGVSFQCWAARKASAKIFSNGEVEYLTHRIDGA